MNAALKQELAIRNAECEAFSTWGLPPSPR